MRNTGPHANHRFPRIILPRAVQLVQHSSPGRQLEQLPNVSRKLLGRVGRISQRENAFRWTVRGPSIYLKPIRVSSYPVSIFQMHFPETSGQIPPVHPNHGSIEEKA